LLEPDVDGTACEHGKYFVIIRKRSRIFVVDAYNVAISAVVIT
jgi:hypothetical protein